MCRHSVVALCLFAIACEGPVGPTGPQGSTGTQGIQGPVGPSGQDGSDGATGPQGAQGVQGAAGTDGATGPQGPVGPQGKTLYWSDIIADSRIEEAVYAIGFRYVTRSRETRYVAVGTGFAAYYSGALWTNAHVVEALREQLDNLAILNPEPVAVRSGTLLGGSGTYEIMDDQWIHPGYDGTARSEDIGLLGIDGEVADAFDLLPQDMITSLAIGQPVGTLGFPGELGISNNDALDHAVSTFKDGVVSALRTVDGTVQPHVQVQYNFDATGGTSGSPVFDHNGWVVAVNHAGPEVRVLDVNGREVRIAMGSLDRGIHVASVWGFLNYLESDRIAAYEGTTPGEILTQEPYPHPTYQPFPANWNGETVGP